MCQCSLFRCIWRRTTRIRSQASFFLLKVSSSQSFKLNTWLKMAYDSRCNAYSAILNKARRSATSAPSLLAATVTNNWGCNVYSWIESFVSTFVPWIKSSVLTFVYFYWKGRTFFSTYLNMVYILDYIPCSFAKWRHQKNPSCSVMQYYRYFQSIGINTAMTELMTNDLA